jgi:hypothetical protein
MFWFILTNFVLNILVHTLKWSKMEVEIWDQCQKIATPTFGANNLLSLKGLNY